jgi:hypothetical protein
MPDPTKVHALMLELGDFDHLGITLDTPYERILDRHSELAGGGEEVRRRQVLIPKEEHEMVEERAPQLGDTSRVERPPEIDAADLRAEGPGDSIDAE